jgi:hypothetical protein
MQSIYEWLKFRVKMVAQEINVVEFNLNPHRKEDILVPAFRTGKFLLK